VNFAAGKILLGGKSPPKCTYSIPVQETAKYRGSVPSGILVHPTVRPQYTNVTDRQTRQTGQRFHSIGRTVTCYGRPKTVKLEIVSNDEKTSEYTGRITYPSMLYVAIWFVNICLRMANTGI